MRSRPCHRAGGDVRRDGLGTNVVHVQLVTRRAQARGDASAHRPESDESDFHTGPLCIDIPYRGNGISGTPRTSRPLDLEEPSMRLISLRSLVLAATLLTPISVFAQEAV